MVYNRLFVCGDTHGMYKDTYKLSESVFTEQKLLDKDDVLIQLGDFGWVWHPIGEDEEQDNWLDWFATRRYTVAVVPGNHENYDILKTFPVEIKWGNEVRVLRRKEGSIYFLKRGGSYLINGRKILAIGGAQSWDKCQRIQHISWWEEETLSSSEINNCLDEINANNKEFDYILTHTCPSKHVSRFTSNEIKQICPVSRFLDYIDDTVSFKEWHFGHFHKDKAIQGGKYRCHYNGIPYELK